MDQERLYQIEIFHDSGEFIRLDKKTDTLEKMMLPHHMPHWEVISRGHNVVTYEDALEYVRKSMRVDERDYQRAVMSPYHGNPFLEFKIFPLRIVEVTPMARQVVWMDPRPLVRRMLKEMRAP